MKSPTTSPGRPVASFEPTIDYCVVKIPRWTFEKFPGAEDRLTTSMKSVGETMAIGRTFKEALQKAVRSLEIGRFGLEPAPEIRSFADLNRIEEGLLNPNSRRLFFIAEAFQRGLPLERIYELTRIDPWFLHHIRQMVRWSNAWRPWPGKGFLLNSGSPIF
jgi:carbamoyl-phosphate synthase large subunit